MGNLYTDPPRDNGTDTDNQLLYKIARDIYKFVSGSITAIIGKVGIDQTTPGTTNGVVVNGAVKPATATYSAARFQNLGANATLNVKASAGNVFSLTCFNANAAARYLLLHNSATVSSGAPLYSFLVPAGAQIIVGTDFFTNEGANFDTGIAFGFSTTRDTYTAGTNTDQTTVIHYK